MCKIIYSILKKKEYLSVPVFSWVIIEIGALLSFETKINFTLNKKTHKCLRYCYLICVENDKISQWVY